MRSAIKWLHRYLDRSASIHGVAARTSIMAQAKRTSLTKLSPSPSLSPPVADGMASFINMGDVVAIISLATKATRVIRDSRYAPAEYQELQKELASLRILFSNVERVALASEAENDLPIVPQRLLDSSSIDSVCQLAPPFSSDIQEVIQRCFDLLTSFTKKTEEYNKYLSESSTGNRFVSIWKRLCWAALKRKQVAKLKAELSHQRQSLGMLLSSILLVSTGRIEDIMIRRFTQLEDIHKLLSGPTVWLVDASLHRMRFPFGIFSTWESFRFALKTHLRHGAGGALIARGAFELVHEETHAIVSETTWHDLIKPEATICVNIILCTKRSERVCPSCQQPCDSSGNDIGAPTRCNCGTIIRVSSQQIQAVSGTEDIEQIDVESDDAELRQEFKLLRRFHIVQSKRSKPACGMRQKGDSGRQLRQASEVVLTIPSKHSWMVSSEIRHRRCSVRK